MTPSVLKFTCIHCNASLTVPDSMAGIVGPCPKCGQQIQAPQAQPAPSSVPATFVAEPRERPKTSHPAKIPEPRSKPRSKEELADRQSITPAPRGLPERQAHRKVSPRRSTTDSSRSTQAGRSGNGRPSHRSSSSSSGGRFSRIGVPVLFAVVSAAIVYFLLYHFMPGGPGQTQRETGTNIPTYQPPADPAPPAIDRPEKAVAGSGATHREPNGTNRAGSGEGGTESAPPPLHTINQSEISEAEDLLRSFFGRRTLSERLAMSEPALPAESLKGGILDRPLPPTGDLMSATPKRNTLEDFVDFPFTIDFPVPGSESNEMRPVTVVVRKRGENAPKILIVPLLDLAGGKLDEFVAKPMEGQRTFRAVIEAMPRCFELGIPGAEKKFTYKLSSCNRPSEIARAYASKHSPLAEQLYSPGSGIGWGRRIQATIVLEWNTSEDPEQPYIEMREIKALDWNS